MHCNHNFGKWVSALDGRSFYKLCSKCQEIVYTTDRKLAKEHISFNQALENRLEQLKIEGRI